MRVRASRPGTYLGVRPILGPGGTLMVTRSSGKLGGSSRLTGPLCLMINHRPWRSTMRDGWQRESCKRLRSSTWLSVRMSTAVVSVEVRNFLQGGSPVGPTGSHETGDAGRLRGFLCQGADERCTIREGCRSAYMLGEGNWSDKGNRGGMLVAAARRVG